MKYIGLVVFCLSNCLVVGQKTKEVLFLGNSYTYVNDLPKLLQQIAHSKGDSVFYDQNTPGGYTLEGHTTNTTSMNKIKAHNWDVVVLQEQSQKPSFSPSQVSTDVLPFAKKLVDLIKANDSCTTPLFYMTWGRKYGDAQNCQSYPPICTYQGMQQRLKESYLLMAQNNKVSVAPVGMAWKESIRVDSNLNLYSSDNSHPSIYGSYLAACVFYVSIFNKSCIGAFHPGNVGGGTAFVLQNIADQTVFDSLSLWRIDTNQSIEAKFTYVLNQNTVNFNNQSSSRAQNHQWDFGDGNTSSMKNPTHQYLTHGNYWVTLNSNDGCLQDAYGDSVKIVSTGIKHAQSTLNIAVYPNPACDYIEISTTINQSLAVEFVATGGRVVKRIEVNEKNTRIDVSDLSKGIYWLKIVSDKAFYATKIVLQ